MNTQFTEFLTGLGAFESGIDTTKQYSGNQLDWLMVFDPDKGNIDRSSVNLSNPDDLSSLQYHVHNTLGFLGKYQFGEPLLIDLGYYSPAPGGFYGSTATNEWQGTWTGKNGVYSKEDFMSEVQELAIREAFTMNMGVIEQRLAQTGSNLDDFLGKEFTYTTQGIEHTAVVSMSGILASAHLQGPGGVANLLLNGIASSDEYGTNILSYMDKFGGYDTPFGTAENDTLAGSDYSETFSGGEGINTYETGDGHDKIVIEPNENGLDVVKDFTIGKDVISLANYDNLTYNDLMITENANGDTQIQLPNNQLLILQNVAAADLGAESFIQGNINLSWNANSGDTVVDNYNLQHDLIDLNYAFGVNNLSLYEENGSTIIEVIGNNQRLILEGVQLDEMSAFNFIKAPIGFSEAFFGANADNTPPVDNDTNNNNDVPDNTGGNEDNNNDNIPTDVANGSNEGVYSFTWAWNSHPVIENFDANENVIDLQSFWANYNEFSLYDNTEGNAVIDLNNLNNQTITLDGIAVADLSSQNFRGVLGNYNDAVTDSVIAEDNTDTSNDNNANTDNTTTDEGTTDTYSFTWNWNDHAVIDNFDINNDVIDLKSFWTSYDAINIHDDAQGNAVIDLTDMNNQTITLTGVSVNELSADNITGVSGSFIVEENNNNDNSEGMNDDNSTPPINDTSGEADVFSFTWAWGNQATINNFDLEHDTVDLHSFWITRDQAPVYNNADGNAVIDLTAVNNQTITLNGISTQDLNQDNILF